MVPATRRLALRAGRALACSAIACGALVSACAGEGLDAVESASELETETCSPAQGFGAVNRFQKALNDSLAYAEGTRGHSKDGYDVAFSFKIFRSCAQHPRVVYCQGGLCSNASGRYQFLDRTWDGVARAISATDFEPKSQELGAEYLVTKVRRVNIPSTRGLTATELSQALRKLSWEWASLPPGRYGQPTKTERQMWADYSANVAAALDAGR